MEVQRQQCLDANSLNRHELPLFSDEFRDSTIVEEIVIQISSRSMKKS
ncbi:hypothetical protein KOR42_16780 [Thalassoglobus neptunius]|uniref:Uncharacterized protein n=1 Tax=Thalassoglobus neptunius TaxID=1938619 RepID=A0A5C5X5V6_9PLAN|nr:hypothetical protein KOR42_16780 [Thalassoglobus neptunius]